MNLTVETERPGTEGAQAMEPERECQGCRGTHWETVEEGGTPKVQHCTKCDYWELRRGFAPGVPKALEALRLSDVKDVAGNRDALQHVQHFLDGHHPDLYLHGLPGRGKTYIAVAAINEVHALNDGRRCRFLRVPKLLKGLLLEDEAEWMRWAQGPDVVVLDDLGAQQGTDFARRTIQEIYDERVDRGRRTIFTSNLSLGELRDFLQDDRLPSRISGRAMVVKVDGKDWRLAVGKNRKSKGVQP